MHSKSDVHHKKCKGLLLLAQKKSRFFFSNFTSYVFVNEGIWCENNISSF